MVPGVVLDLLAITSKFYDAGYFTIFDKEEVNIYDAATTAITTPKLPIPKGWRDRFSTLWRIPLVKRAPGTDIGQVTNQVPRANATSGTPAKPY